MKKKITIGSVVTAIAFIVAGLTYKQRRKYHVSIPFRIRYLLCNVRNWLSSSSNKTKPKTKLKKLSSD